MGNRRKSNCTEFKSILMLLRSFTTHTKDLKALLQHVFRIVGVVRD